MRCGWSRRGLGWSGYPDMRRTGMSGRWRAAVWARSSLWLPGSNAVGDQQIKRCGGEQLRRLVGIVRFDDRKSV